MDQTLSRLSEAFARVRKPVTKKRRRRRRKRPITAEGRLYQAHNTLAKSLRLKREAGSAKRLAAKLTVTVIDPDGRTSWRVSGGQCEHVVLRMAGELECVDHSPAHAPPLEGFACSHEIAVRRYLVQAIFQAEVAA